MAAVRGQPRANIDTQAPVLAVVSRYFRDEKTKDCVFFFQTQNEAEKQEWIKAFHINAEWASRFSAMDVAKGSYSTVRILMVFLFAFFF
jgi:hypothetical protein